MRVTCLLYQRGTCSFFAFMYVLVKIAPIPNTAGTTPYNAIWSIIVRLAARVAKGMKQLTIEFVERDKERDGAFYCYKCLKTDGRTLKLA